MILQKKRSIGTPCTKMRLIEFPEDIPTNKGIKNREMENKSKDFKVILEVRSAKGRTKMRIESIEV